MLVSGSVSLREESSYRPARLCEAPIPGIRLPLLGQARVLSTPAELGNIVMRKGCEQVVSQLESPVGLAFDSIALNGPIRGQQVIAIAVWSEDVLETLLGPKPSEDFADENRMVPP